MTIIIILVIIIIFMWIALSEKSTKNVEDIITENQIKIIKTHKKKD